MKIKDIRAREVLATSAEKTIEIEVLTEKGVTRASAPIGTSRGKYEAVSYPAEDVVKKFLLIKRAVRSQDYSSQREVDDKLREMDRTSNFRDIGGNLAIAISSAFLKAFAQNENQEVFEYVARQYKLGAKIPVPLSIVAGGWKGSSDIQEFHVVPVHQKSFSESVTKISHAYKRVGELLHKEDPLFRFSKNLESGWSTALNFEKVLKIVKKAAEENLLKVGIDFAASHLWDKNNYVYSNGEKISPHDHVALVEKLCRKYSVFYIEDPVHEEDFLNFALLTHRLQPRLICGDDLYATRVNRLIYGTERKASNAAVVKPNQVGTISDTVEFVREAKKNKIATVMSHRSVETDDALIAHLAVGFGCDYVKMGIAGERIIKMNELIRIEERMREGE